MSAEFDEHALIRQAQAGDGEALGALYEHYVTPVYRFMFYRTGDVMVAEDLTAEVFGSVMSAIQRYEDRGVPFEAWLFRIARARLADYWRSVKRREKYHQAFAEKVRAEWDGSTYTATVSWEHENLQQAFQYLTPAEAEVITLRFASGLSHKEIALVIRSNANAVKSKMRRALKKLKGILERQQAFDEQRETYEHET